MRILVTNDDGIDSIGMHVLARAMCRLDGDHEIIVAAPDEEYSGAGASLGALHLIHPEVRRAHIDDCPADAIWSVTGPPALCVMFSRLGAFGPPFDLGPVILRCFVTDITAEEAIKFFSRTVERVQARLRTA